MDDKGDLKVPNLLREECKTTYSASYVLKYADLAKVAAAAERDEIPALTVAFGDDMRNQWTAIPTEWFRYLLELERARRASE